MRRRTPQQIKKLLTRQAASKLSIAGFCDQHGLNAGTFYAWRLKYKDQKNPSLSSSPQGFTRLLASPPPTMPTTMLHLPGGAYFELIDWSVTDIARLTRALNPAATDA